MEKIRRINLNSNFRDAIPPSELLNRGGLENSVFDADEARKEKKLDSVMEFPTWFFEILGNKDDLDFVIVTGERGSGKSALRRSIANHCRTEIGNDILQGTILCINLDHDSPNWIKRSKESGKSIAECFCEEIVEELAISIFSFVDKDDLKEKLLRDETYLLERYLLILKNKKPDEINVMAEKILSTYKKIKLNDEFSGLVTLFTGILGREVSINETKPQKVEPINDIQKLINILKKFGFDAVYVLVDEIDEYPETCNNPDFAAEVIASILSNINLLEKDSIGFKFFLPVQVYCRINDACERLGCEIRYDRTLHSEPYALRWNDDDILKILKKRLMIYSNNKINTFKNFASDDLAAEIDNLIVKYAYKSPRHLIQLCNRIVRFTARTANCTDNKITKSVFEEALSDYLKLCWKIYPENSLQGILEYGREKFSDAEFSEYFGVSLEDVKRLLNELVSLRALKSRMDIHNNNHYKIVDPRLLILLNRENDSENDW